MKSTFNLKNPKGDKETLILFSAYFKNEGRKFVYSTGEYIHPDEWNFEQRCPKDINGRTAKAEKHRAIQRQLNRYSNYLSDLIREYKLSEREPLISNTREDFDKEFKRTKSDSNKFFMVYRIFLDEKKTDYTESANSTSTIRRYEYNMKLLLEFEEQRGKKIHFNQINKEFYNKFIQYCIDVKRHSANTLRRNVGLFKTFMYWAFDNGYTYKTDFQKFKLPKSQITDEVALTLEQVKEVLKYDLSKNPRLEKVRDLFVFGCSTGMRISNYGKVRKKDVQDGVIKVRDEKNNDKILEIPLNDISLQILEKYEYDLPAISTQKFNNYIKEAFKLMGYDSDVKKTMKIGKEIIEKIQPLYERISSHTARRSFITIMKNKKIPDKIIMEYTGHKSLEVFNKYYKPNREDKKAFMEQVWKLETKDNNHLKLA